MANPPKQKGTAYENEVLEALLPVAGSVERCGAIVGHPGDVKLCMFRWAYTGDHHEFSGRPSSHRTNQVYYLECKRRASAWKELYTWLDKNRNDFLALRADRERTLIVMDIEQFKSLLAGQLPKPRRDEDE